MHLPDHYLDPTTSAVTALVSGGAVSYAWFRMRREATTKALPAAAVGAVIFAAQMVNFPIVSGTSGHLVGGALAGILLGPWAGLVTMAAVLAVQAFIFGDGGILALGANILNMGVIGVSMGAACRAVPSYVAGSAGAPLTSRAIGARAITAAIAGCLSVVLAALACALEMAISGAAATSEVVPAMLGVHALIGLPEAAITALVATSLAYLPSPATAPRNNVWRFGLISAAAIAVLLAPFASSLPDGLERIAESFVTSTNSAAILPSLFSDYALPGVPSPFAATALAGVLGMLMVYVFCRIVFSTGLRHPSAGG